MTLCAPVYHHRQSRQVAEVLTALAARGPYFKLTAAQRFQVGKGAAEHGIAAFIRFFEKKHPDLRLKETTVRRLKNLYQSEIRNKLSGGTCDGKGEGKLCRPWRWRVPNV